MYVILKVVVKTFVCKYVVYSHSQSTIKITKYYHKKSFVVMSKKYFG